MVFSLRGIRVIVWLFLRLTLQRHCSSRPTMRFLILIVQLFRGFVKFSNVLGWWKCDMLSGKLIDQLMPQLLLGICISWELSFISYLLVVQALFCTRTWLVWPFFALLCSFALLGLQPNNLPTKDSFQSRVRICIQLINNL